MIIALILSGLLLWLLLLSDGEARGRATVGEFASARMIAAARLRHFADEREERFRHYHRAWSAGAGRRAPGRGYVVPFAAGGRR